MAKWLTLNICDRWQDDLMPHDLSDSDIHRYVRQLAESLGALSDGEIEWVWFSVIDPDEDDDTPYMFGTYTASGEFARVNADGDLEDDGVVEKDDLESTNDEGERQ